MTPTAPAAAIAEHLRPVAHFTARESWLNDPNGLLFHRGVWHLFYQNNPFGSRWGNISWGHATSTDLTTWEHRPVAIPANENEQVFSGSAVVDTRNTSGFGAPGQTPLVAVYTSAYRGDHPLAGLQTQSLAFSVDDGETWQRYAHNPVLDIGSSEFRDPKVFWYGDDQGGHWVMVAVEAAAHRVAVYVSDNLIDWTFASHFGPAHAVGGVWECPDLFPLTVRDTGEQRWVMLVSLNPGGIAGGSGTQYFVGSFDGREFVAEGLRDSSAPADSDWLDYGRDCYAPVSFSGVPDGRRVIVGWASNWQYANETPTTPWRSAMTIARELDLVRWADGRLRVAQRPILPAHLPREGLLVHRLVVPMGEGDRTEIVLSTADGADRVVVSLDGAAATLSCDRTESGDVAFHDAFPSVQVAPLPREEEVDLQILIDGCVLEIFAAGGRTVLTDVVFPRSPLDTIAVNTTRSRD